MKTTSIASIFLLILLPLLLEWLIDGSIELWIVIALGFQSIGFQRIVLQCILLQCIVLQCIGLQSIGFQRIGFQSIGFQRVKVFKELRLFAIEWSEFSAL